MPTIQRLSRAEYERGLFEARPGFVAIRIAGRASPFNDVQHAGLHAEHRFEFEDVEHKGHMGWEGAITDAEADQIVRILQQALDEGRDVVVHCGMGIYRSGAVCDFAGSWFNYLNPGNGFNTEVARMLARALSRAGAQTQWSNWAAQRNAQR